MSMLDIVASFSCRVLGIIGYGPFFVLQKTIAESKRDTPNNTDESSSLLGPGRNGGKNAEQQTKIVKGALYAVQVFYSFFIM